MYTLAILAIFILGVLVPCLLTRIALINGVELEKEDCEVYHKREEEDNNKPSPKDADAPSPPSPPAYSRVVSSKMSV